MSSRYFEYRKDTSNKFWGITIKPHAFMTRCGPIDKTGQTSRKEFDDAEQALRAS